MRFVWPGQSQPDLLATPGETRLLTPTTGEVTGEVTVEVTGEVTGEVAKLLTVLKGEMKRAQLQQALGLRHEDHFRDAYLSPALAGGWIEMTIPDKPRSRLQKYRLTALGRDVQKS